VATKRDIEDVLRFREDISPFLVHLTRNVEGCTARKALFNILQEMKLKRSSNKISDVKYGGYDLRWSKKDITFYFGAAEMKWRALRRHCRCSQSPI